MNWVADVQPRSGVANEDGEHLEPVGVVDPPRRTVGDEGRCPGRKGGRLAAERATAAAREHVEDLVVGLIRMLVRGAVEAQNALLELVAPSF
jgi:hypothetical protein